MTGEKAQPCCVCYVYAALNNTLYYFEFSMLGLIYLKQCSTRPLHTSSNQNVSYPVVTVYCSNVYLKLLLYLYDL